MVSPGLIWYLLSGPCWESDGYHTDAAWCWSFFCYNIPWFCQPFCTFLPTHVTRDVHRYVHVAKRHVFFDSVEPLQKSKFHRPLEMSVSHKYLKCNNFTDRILHYLHEENLNEWPVACQVKPMQLLRNQHGLPDGIGWSFSLSLLLRRCRLFKNWCAWDWARNSSTLVEQRQTLEHQHVRCDSKPWLVVIRTG